MNNHSVSLRFFRRSGNRHGQFLRLMGILTAAKLLTVRVDARIRVMKIGFIFFHDEKGVRKRLSYKLRR